MSDLPYLFLDVDGVLNALDGLNKGDWDDFKKHDVWAPLGGVHGAVRQKFRLRISKKMCAALAALPAEIHWATTWEHLANDLLWEHTGFNDYPVACRMATGLTHQIITDQDVGEIWWKFRDIYAMVEKDPRPFIWCDDEAIPPFADEQFRELGQPFLLIKPDAKVGLTHVDLDKIRNFLAEPQLA